MSDRKITHFPHCQLFVYNFDLLVWRGSRDSVETTRWCPLFLLGSSRGWPVDEVKCVRFDLTLEVGEVTTDEMAELSAENLVGVWLLSRPVVTSSWWFLTNRLFLELLWCWCWWYILLLKCCCCCCFLRITEPELKKKRIKIILFWKFHNFVGQNILLRFTFIMFIFVNINLVTLPLLPKTFYWWCLQRRMNGNTHLGGKTSTRWEWQKSTRKRGTPYSSTLTQGFILVSSQFEKCWILLTHTLLI